MRAKLSGVWPTLTRMIVGVLHQVNDSDYASCSADVSHAVQSGRKNEGLMLAKQHNEAAQKTEQTTKKSHEIWKRDSWRTEL